MRSSFLAVLGLASALATCAACGTPTQPAQTPHTDDSAALERVTVALVELAPGATDARAFCSGVWLRPDLILTANHCVKELGIGERVAYVTRSDVEAAQADELEAAHLARVSVRDTDHDLALLTVRFAPAHDVAELADSVTIGEPAQTMGHPLGLWWSYSAGEVAAVRAFTLDDDAPPSLVVQSTAPISPGNSGGGLFNARGQLMGVCDAHLPRGENLNLFVHVAHVRALLERAGL